MVEDDCYRGQARAVPCDFLFKCAVYKYTYLLTYINKVLNIQQSLAKAWHYRDNFIVHVDIGDVSVSTRYVHRLSINY